MESTFKSEITGLQSHYRGNSCNYQQIPAAVFYLHNNEHVFYFTGAKKGQQPCARRAEPAGGFQELTASHKQLPTLFQKSWLKKSHGGVSREDKAQFTGVWGTLKLNLVWSSKTPHSNLIHPTAHTRGYLCPPEPPRAPHIPHQSQGTIWTLAQRNSVYFNPSG